MGHVPLTARRFPSRVGMVISIGFCMSRDALQVTQYALTGSIRQTRELRSDQYMLLRARFKCGVDITRWESLKKDVY